MAIRHIVAADRQAYIDLYTATAAEGRWIGGELPVDVDEVGSRVDSALAEENVAILVAADGNDSAIGHLGLSNQGGIVSFGMMIDAEHRGKGLGAQLLTAAIAWANASGAHKMTLQVWPHNERAIRLYEGAGFVTEGRLVRQYKRANGELWDSLVMGLPLPFTPNG